MLAPDFVVPALVTTCAAAAMMRMGLNRGLLRARRDESRRCAACGRKIGSKHCPSCSRR